MQYEVEFGVALRDLLVGKYVDGSTLSRFDWFIYLFILKYFTPMPNHRCLFQGGRLLKWNKTCTIIYKVE